MQIIILFQSWAKVLSSGYLRHSFNLVHNLVRHDQWAPSSLYAIQENLFHPFPSCCCFKVYYFNQWAFSLLIFRCLFAIFSITRNN